MLEGILITMAYANSRLISGEVVDCSLATTPEGLEDCNKAWQGWEFGMWFSIIVGVIVFGMIILSLYINREKEKKEQKV